MAKSFTDRSAGRIADSVRYTEAEQRNLSGRPQPNAMVPFEICRFEMQAELALPENGPGTSRVTKLRWESTRTHIDWTYDTLATLGGFGTFDASERGASGQGNGEQWTGDYDNAYPPDDHLEKIIVFDGMRNHSKMRTRGDDVGAYGIAWKPHDSLVRHKLAGYSGTLPFWEILTMQTPGPFYGRLRSAMGYNEQTAYQLQVLGRDDVFDNTSGHRTLRGYDPFGQGWSDYYGGLYVTAWNPTSYLGEIGTYCFGGKAGNLVYCEWHMRLGAYVIRWIEPNDYGYSSFVCDGNTIKVPPWVTGSP